MGEFLEPELTNKVIGIAFEIFNKVGPGYPERVYQKAFEQKFKENNIQYSKENYCKIEIDGFRIGSFRLDFLVGGRVIVELKVREQFYNTDTAQLLSYMRVKRLKVGLILLFTSKEVKIKRLVL